MELYKAGLKKIDQEDKEHWIEIIEVLDTKLKIMEKDKVKPLLIAQLILERESAMYMEMESD